jgi:hypothetical protein
MGNITMEHKLTHGSVVAFGAELNSVATHSVIGGGNGHRMSLVYEFAAHDEQWLGEKTTPFHTHMRVAEGVFKVLPLATSVKKEPVC